MVAQVVKHMTTGIKDPGSNLAGSWEIFFVFCPSKITPQVDARRDVKVQTFDGQRIVSRL